MTAVDPEGAQRLMAEGALLLDVREDEEWEAGHAPEAVHLPMGLVGERIEELPTDRTVVCVCRVGGRSGAVATALDGAGYDVRNLVEDRWSHLVADTDDELHAFAARLGMKREWFQHKSNRPHQGHYDVPERARPEALELGAVPVTWRQVGRMMRNRRTGISDGAGPGASGGAGQDGTTGGAGQDGTVSRRRP